MLLPSMFSSKIFCSLLPSVLYILNPHGLKLLTRLRIDLSHLWGHKFKHNFSDCPHEISMCGKGIESTNHFLLQCSLFFKERHVLMNKICDIDSSLIDQNERLNSYRAKHPLLVSFYILHCFLEIQRNFISRECFCLY